MYMFILDIYFDLQILIPPKDLQEKLTKESEEYKEVNKNHRKISKSINYCLNTELYFTLKCHFLID